MVKALGSQAATGEQSDGGLSVDLPEPLASVVDYLSDESDDREFIPTSELVEALGVDPTLFGQQMRELGCDPTRDRVPTEDGGTRQVRGYRTGDIRTAVRAVVRAADRDPADAGAGDHDRVSQPGKSGVTW